MRMRWWVALAVTPWIAGCGGESEPSHETTNTAEANAPAVEASAPDAHDGAAGTSGAVVLAPPAVGGLPEVRYYTLGGA